MSRGAARFADLGPPPDTGPGVRAAVAGWHRVARNLGLAVALPAALMFVAEWGARAGWFPAQQLPPPSEIAGTLAELAGRGLGVHVFASAARVAAGFALGAVLALLAGTLVGLNRVAATVLEPTFQALRAIPSLAWVPLLLLWLGIDEASKIALIAIGAFFPVYMGVSSGLRDVDRKLIEVAELAGFRGSVLARRVLLPAALPAIFTGVRNGLSLAWMFMVAAELIAATRGLGYLLTDGRETGRTDIVIAAIVILALLGKASDTALAAVERRWLDWRDTLGTRA